jgi:hypothetical protein
LNENWELRRIVELLERILTVQERIERELRTYPALKAITVKDNP